MFIRILDTIAFYGITLLFEYYTADSVRGTYGSSVREYIRRGQTKQWFTENHIIWNSSKTDFILFDFLVPCRHFLKYLSILKEN